jgi:DNA repair protein RecN (Recombination protein N)
VLRELRITGLGVIQDLDLELHPGLNVFTGETGAGKTMITVGLALALGGRGSASLVRAGSGAAKIQARFDAPADASDWAEDGELILARTVSAEGKTTVRIGGQLATASAAAQIGEGLVEIHGQHHALRLRSAATQTAFLDRSVGPAHVAALEHYGDRFARLAEIVAELEALREVARGRERELDLLAYQVQEIERVGPRPDERRALEAEEARLAHVERLQELVGAAEAALAQEGAAADGLAQVAAALDTAASVDPAAEALDRRARGLAAEAADLAHELRRYREELLADPEELHAVRERLGALGSLHRKYGATEEEVLAFLVEARERLGALAGADERIDVLEARRSALVEETTGLARGISEARAAAAPRLARALENELRELGMPGASVRVELVPTTDLGPSGAEHAQLAFGAGPSQPAQPLAKTASGGELSRTMLACRSVLADLDDVPTLIFDEVDAGIGGEAGLAVGRRLARLAQDRQVLVVTHLPQIACFADRHVRVLKRDGVATADILGDHDRVVELSRMLAGLTDSAGAMTHAEELLTEAARARADA